MFVSDAIHPRAARPRAQLSAVAAVLIALVVAVGGGGGGQTRQNPQAVAAFRGGDAATAAELLGQVAEVTDEDYALNNLQLGTVALADGDLATAERALYRVWELINAAGVNDPARAAAGTTIDPRLLVWRGEPFERAMACFYLGTTYYLKGDYANARAAFENALLKIGAGESDRPADRATREREFAVAHLMLARAWHKLGRDDLARRRAAAVVAHRPDLRGVAGRLLRPDTNVLLIVDYGQGPQRDFTFADADVVERDGAVYDEFVAPAFQGFWPGPADAERLVPGWAMVDGTAQAHVLWPPPVDLLRIARRRARPPRGTRPRASTTTPRSTSGRRTNTSPRRHASSMADRRIPPRRTKTNPRPPAAAAAAVARSVRSCS